MVQSMCWALVLSVVVVAVVVAMKLFVVGKPLLVLAEVVEILLVQPANPTENQVILIQCCITIQRFF